MQEKKILIVEDEEDILSMINEKLSEAGFYTATARKGQEALEIILEEPPDLVLMDILLPDMEGSDVVRQMQEEDHLRDLPVVFLSGIVTKPEAGKCPKVCVGGRDYTAVGKPFTLQELLNAIRPMLEDE